jgi:O-acetyl-ADP-ribose deacetylase (regulator of RNase III)
MTVIAIKKQDLFDPENKVIGHGCNIKGQMFAGIARLFYEKYKTNFEGYQKVCSEGLYKPGSVYVCTEFDGRVIVNLATQDNPGRNARLSWVKDSLKAFEDLGVSNQISLPWVGCGIGGLSWEDVIEVFEDSALEITICDPFIND